MDLAYGYVHYEQAVEYGPNLHFLDNNTSVEVIEVLAREMANRFGVVFYIPTDSGLDCSPLLKLMADPSAN